MRTAPIEPNDLQRQKRKTIPCPSGRPPSRPHRGLSHHHYHKSHHRIGDNSVVACSGDMLSGEANARSLLALRRSSQDSSNVYMSADVMPALVPIQANATTATRSRQGGVTTLASWRFGDEESPRLRVARSGLHGDLAEMESLQKRRPLNMGKGNCRDRLHKSIESSVLSYLVPSHRSAL
jgi:hypothetical protein